MQLYKQDLKGEKLIGILSDDYIKFIRFCHWKIEQSGAGIVGLITKNTYLNIAAAKGMRKQLLLTFDKIYILNIHGKLYEKSPDGLKDKSVFDIRVGTAILFLIKSLPKKKSKYAKLFYKDLYGDRNFKYDFLNNKDLLSTFNESNELKIDENQYFFEKKDFRNFELYDKFWSVKDIFIEKGSGVKTHRDHFIIADNKDVLLKRLRDFLKFDVELAKNSFNLNKTSNFEINNVKKKFLNIFG